jgi:hypothetical protein
MTEQQFEIQRAHCLSVWRKVLKEFLGWTDEEANEFIDKWSDLGLNDRDSIFWHETPVYYLTSELLPPSLRLRLTGTAEIYQLISRVEKAFGSEEFMDSTGLSYNWDIVKHKVSTILAEYGESLPVRS